MAIIEGTRELKTYRGTYSFAVLGGTQGTIVLSSADGPIPTGSVIVSGYIDITTPPDSAAHTATVAVTVEGANDIVSAIIVTNAQWVAAGRKSMIPAGTGVTAVKTTAGRSPSIVVATQDLTAGVFDVVLLYR